MEGDKIKTNILIAGKSGVGKSSLLNYIFGEEVAETGAGKPVTAEGLHEYSFELKDNDRISFSICDSWGLEPDKADEWHKQIIDKVAEYDKHSINEWFSTIIYCLSAAQPTETTTTTTAEATTTKPVTTLAPYDIYDDTVYANDLIYETADDIFAELGDDFSMDFISVGQENIIAVENDDVYPNTKIGFYTTDIQNIGTLDFPYAIHVTPGGYITEGVQVGMTYNELKAICPSLEGATLDGGTFGPTAWINIDGNAWGIEFDVSQADRERLGMAVGVAVDLSELNPKSTLGYYISSLS